MVLNKIVRISFKLTSAYILSRILVISCFGRIFHYSRLVRFFRREDYVGNLSYDQNLIAEAKIDCTENEHIRVDTFSHLSSHYIFLFMDCTAISDMTVHPFLTLHDAETSVH